MPEPAPPDLQLFISVRYFIGKGYRHLLHRDLMSRTAGVLPGSVSDAVLHDAKQLRQKWPLWVIGRAHGVQGQEKVPHEISDILQLQN